MAIFIRLSVLLIIAFNLLFCSKQNPDSSENFSFKIDSAEIAPLVYLKDFNISFHPPIDWLKYASGLSENTISPQSRSKFEKGNFLFKPKHIFIDRKSNSVLSVGVVNAVEGKGSGGKFFEEYLDVLKNKYDAEISEAQLQAKGIAKYSTVIVRLKNIVSVKFIFVNKSGNLIQFEYSTQQENYSGLKSSIQSSLGTLIADQD